MRWLNNTEGRRDQICPKLEYFLPSFHSSLLHFRTLFTFRTFSEGGYLLTNVEIADNDVLTSFFDDFS